MEFSEQKRPGLWARWREHARKRRAAEPRWAKVFGQVYKWTLLLLVVAVLVYAWRGRVAWRDAQRELAGQGEKLTLEELMPPPMPDELNFFADPLWDEVREKEVVAANGRVDFVPVLPLEKQRLSAGAQKLGPEEIAALQKAYPRLGDQNSPVTRRGLLGGSWAKAPKMDAAWREELAKLTLEVLKPEAPTLARVEELLKRPGGHFRSNYEDGANAEFSQLSPLLLLGQAFLYRARAEVVLGERQAAFADVQNLIALSHVLQTEPYAMLYLVRLYLVEMSLSALEGGIKAHVWQDGDLMAFEKALKAEDVLPGLLLALRTERAGFNSVMEQMRGGNFRTVKIREQRVARPGEGSSYDKWATRALWQTEFFIGGAGDQADTNRRLQKVIDLVKMRSWAGLDALPRDERLDMASVIYLITHLYSPYLSRESGVWDRAAKVQEAIAQTRIACGLERYYLAKKEYPEALDALVPEYLSTLPGDILTGSPMHYKRTKDGAFLLWANGWDGKDDGGRPVKSQERDGDWVWLLRKG